MPDKVDREAIEKEYSCSLMIIKDPLHGTKGKIWALEYKNQISE